MESPLETASVRQPVQSHCDSCSERKNLGQQRRGDQGSAWALQQSARNGCKPCGAIWRGIQLYIDTAHPGYLLHGLRWGKRDYEIGLQPPVLINVELAYFGLSRHFRLKLYAEKAHPESIFGVGRFVPLNSSSESTLNLMSTWLGDCLRDHSKCHAIGNGDRPSRLLDIGPNGPGGEKVRLTDFEEGMTPHIALSYCWGKTLSFTTTKKSLNTRKAGIPWTELPRTFQDAIKITKTLGYRYIWIDALCIVQDDLADWERESAKMSNIYRSSLLTISVAHGKDTTAGCFHDREHSNGQLESRISQNESLYRSPVGQDRISFDYQLNEDEHQRVHVSRDFYHLPLLEARVSGSATPPGGKRPFQQEPYPLFKRAWALQERLLSPRIVHLMPSEISWECSTCVDCECGELPFSEVGQEQQDKSDRFRTALSRGVKEDADLSPRKPFVCGSVSSHASERLLAWKSVVEDYSKRELSRPSDKLAAISGLAHLFSRRIHGGYFAGIWEAELPFALLWNLKPFKNTHVENLSQQPYRAPSWSWAASDGTLSMGPGLSYGDSEVEWYSHAQVEDVSCTPLGRDPMGRVLSGSMTLTGPFSECGWGGPGSVPYLDDVFGFDIDGVGIRRCSVKFESTTRYSPSQKRMKSITFSVMEHRRLSSTSISGIDFTQPFYLLCIASVNMFDFCNQFQESERCDDVKFEGLLLRKSRSHKGAYERFGMFRFTLFSSSLYAKWSRPDPGLHIGRAFELSTVKVV